MFPIDITPEKLAEEIADFSRKLAEGTDNLSEVIGVDAGVSPKQAVYKEDKLVLYRYSDPNAVAAEKIPLLIVYALVNRPYMMDLQENRSTIKNLLAQGQDIYLIDWGYPDDYDASLTLDDYLNGYLDNCVDFICKEHGLDKINLLGICQGGTFSLCYSALQPDKVKNLITMVTPVDFKTPDNLLSAWVQHLDVDTLVDTLGNIPGEMLNWTFMSLKPFSLNGQKYLGMIDLLDDKDKLKNFMRMEKWIADSPDQAGETFRQFIKNFFQENKLIKGKLKIGDQTVDLKKLKMPVLNIIAEQDHLVPPDASKAMADKVGTKDYTELSFPVGHIGIYVSAKVQKQVPPLIASWLDERAG